MDPSIVYVPTQRQIANLPSPFKKLSKEDLKQEWAKEVFIGLHFANELDLYRAITSFKRALILLPSSQADRRFQIEYNIVLCYYFGQKYQEAIYYYTSSHLDSLTENFPANRDLLIILFDSYQHIGQNEKAEAIRQKLALLDPNVADQLLLSLSIQQADLCQIYDLKDVMDDDSDNSIDNFLNDYHSEALSVSKAKMLNALLPGAGYYYVGQKNAAVTSFLINALFTWGAYAFIKNGYIAAGIITASLETGWYIGGINGAGIEANEYNQRLYENKAKDLMVKNKLFPVLTLKTSF
jgi:tetratricopeptide (TPR) repeat protein